MGPDPSTAATEAATTGSKTWLSNSVISVVGSGPIKFLADWVIG